MTKLTKKHLTLNSSDETEQLAEAIGKNLKGGETVELAGDLGSGKTTFVRGLARGIGSSDNVASPSFTLSHRYDSDSLTLYHFDFYRLSQPGLITLELAETMNNPANVTVIEWADIIQGVLPDDRLTIEFEHTGSNRRHLELSYPNQLNYLLKGLDKIVSLKS